MIDATRKIRRSGDVVFRSVAGESLLIPIRGNVADLRYLFALNPVGEFIWRELESAKTAGEIVERVLESFDVSREEAEQDVRGFLDELIEQGLAAEAAD